MIVYENIPVMAAEYRGTIEVYRVEFSRPFAEPIFEWYWRCKSRNSQILASGEGYKRRAGALNAINAQYAVRLIGADRATDVLGIRAAVLPWRLVIHDRHGTIERIGAVY
ncbi:hypothetical protein SEA_GUDMIT_49 [Gordonia phage Gudmit]|nr:hypothetical protein SEA_GUDMIT_49 [Gordonia phage Gudmit]